jgi:hypothetical protein
VGVGRAFEFSHVTVKRNQVICQKDRELVDLALQGADGAVNRYYPER